jgi:hypothetical protein
MLKAWPRLLPSCVSSLGNACDGWCEITLQLIAPNLPDATEYKAKRECS